MARECIIPVFVPHLGCPNSCVFCNQRRISGEQEPATPETVRGAIENSKAFLPEDSRKQLAFYGGSFTAIPGGQQEELLAVGKEYLDNGYLSSIRLSTRPDAIDVTVMNRLHRYGVETVELGAQSLDDEVLRRSARGHSAQDVVNASAMLKASGFRLILQMMTGLPGDDGSQSVATAEKIIALDPDGVRIYPTVIVRDTALYDMWIAGKYREHSVEDAVEVCSRIVPMFEKVGIPIIRLGLNPTDDLSGGTAAGGAYHPALGELVKSRVMLNEAAALLEKADIRPGCAIEIRVPKAKVSQMTGQHRRNISALRERFPAAEITVRGTDGCDGISIGITPPATDEEE